jgi:hypothetical protein
MANIDNIQPENYRDVHKYINNSEKATKKGSYDILAFKLFTFKLLN